MTRQLSSALSVGHWILALAWLSFTQSALLNITVDDYYRDPLTNTTWVTYTPYEAWALSVGTPCDTCTAHPDPSHTYFSTWHEGVYNAGGGFGSDMYASFDFEGAYSGVILSYLFYVTCQSGRRCRDIRLLHHPPLGLRTKRERGHAVCLGRTTGRIVQPHTQRDGHVRVRRASVCEQVSARRQPHHPNP